MTHKQYVGLFMALVALAILLAFRTPSAQVAGQALSASFGGVSLKIEYATTTAARELGLSGRIYVPKDYGMIFVFPSDDRYGFWMKDMLVPLDIFWLDDKGQVVYIVQDVLPSTYPDVLYPPVPARYVLETAAGFARAHAVTVGTPLLLKNFPSVSE